MSGAIVLRTVKKHGKRFEACYARVIRRKPAVAGTLTAQLTIGPTSMVVAGRADGLDDDLGRCVMQVLREIQFPKSQGGGSTVVRLPISFHMEVPTELRDAPLATVPDAGPTLPPSPLAALTWADEGADSVLDRWVADRATGAVRDAVTAATECGLADLTGSLRARLAVGGDGAVLANEVWGLGNAAAEDCLRDRLAKVSLAAPPSPVAVTCDVVAGTALPWKLTVRPEHHTIDVDGADLASLRGAPDAVHVVRVTATTPAPALARVLDALERPRVPYLIGVDDGSGGLVLVGELVPRGAGPASSGAWPRLRLAVSPVRVAASLVGSEPIGTASPDDARALRELVTRLADCKDCERIVELVPSDDADGRRIRQTVEAVHAAGLDRIVIVGPAPP